jgi:hypothetical protein
MSTELRGFLFGDRKLKNEEGFDKQTDAFVVDENKQKIVV